MFFQKHENENKEYLLRQKKTTKTAQLKNIFNFERCLYVV